MELQYYIDESHNHATQAGFYEGGALSLPHHLMMVITEFVEAIESQRECAPNEKLLEELADAALRFFDLIAVYDPEKKIEEIMQKKMEKNKIRGKRHGKKY